MPGRALELLPSGVGASAPRGSWRPRDARAGARLNRTRPAQPAPGWRGRASRRGEGRRGNHPRPAPITYPRTLRAARRLAALGKRVRGFWRRAHYPPQGNYSPEPPAWPLAPSPRVTSTKLWASGAWLARPNFASREAQPRAGATGMAWGGVALATGRRCAPKLRAQSWAQVHRQNSAPQGYGRETRPS